MNAPSTFALPADPGDDSDDADGRLRRRTSRAFALIGLLLLGLFALAALLKVGGAVIGSGEVAVESSVKTISHPTGGIITAMLVRDGDRVVAGQELIRFDTTVSRVGSQSAAAGLEQLLARRARLQAERGGEAAIRFPPALAQSNDPQVRELVTRELSLFRLRQIERTGVAALLDQRIRQYESQVQSYQAQIDAIERQQALIEPELGALRDLYQRKLATVGRVNELERAAVQLAGSKAALQSNIAQARAQISEVREQKLNVDKNIRSEAATELAAVIAQINDQEVRSASASDAFARSVIRAPQSGTVDKIAFTTVGSAVPPAQPILQLVPDSDDLIVEARVRPQDVDQIRVGQATRVVFSGLNLQTTPDIAGTLIFVSAELAQDERTGQSFYRTKVRLDPQALAEAPQIQLKAGMPAEVFIQTGDRSILSFLLKPMIDQLRYAMREE